MKTSREHKRLLAIGRKLHGKRNGVIGGWWFDCAEFIWKHADRKRCTEQRRCARDLRDEISAALGKGVEGERG
jgi:hypothetical protein